MAWLYVIGIGVGSFGTTYTAASGDPGSALIFLYIAVANGFLYVREIL